MDNQIENEIIGMERAALDRWSQGDPTGFLDICTPYVVYFDPSQERRLNGLAALTSLYESLRGQIRIERYDLIDPKVQVYGNVAVLTFNYISYSQGETQGWNCSEIYVKNPENPWRIVHTHWSRTGTPR